MCRLSFAAPSVCKTGKMLICDVNFASRAMTPLIETRVALAKLWRNPAIDHADMHGTMSKSSRPFCVLTSRTFDLPSISSASTPRSVARAPCLYYLHEGQRQSAAHGFRHSKSVAFHPHPTPIHKGGRGLQTNCCPCRVELLEEKAVTARGVGPSVRWMLRWRPRACPSRIRGMYRGNSGHCCFASQSFRTPFVLLWEVIKTHCVACQPQARVLDQFWLTCFLSLFGKRAGRGGWSFLPVPVDNWEETLA